MDFKDARQSREWWPPSPLAPVVRGIVNAGADYVRGRWGWNFVITDIYRSPEEDAALEGTGIHTTWRAVDVRTIGIEQDAVDDLTAWINARYVYDPARPNLTCCYTKPHGNAPHAHFQCHPNTILRPNAG